MKVVRLADVSGDVRHTGVEDALKEASEYKEDGFTPTSAVVLLLDETGGGYQLRRITSNLKVSELISLFEVAKLTEFQRRNTLENLE